MSGTTGPKYYNQPNGNIPTMSSLLTMTDPKAKDIPTTSGLPMRSLRIDALASISTGKLREVIEAILAGRPPADFDKGPHRNADGYLPGTVYGPNVQAQNCDFTEYFIEDNKDLRKGIKNGDRRIVHDRPNNKVYLTMVHYDRWTEGKAKDDGSPTGAGKARNPFFLILT